MAKDSFRHGYALLIAVNENQMPNYALPTVAKDAAALYEVLVHPDRCAYPPENVRLLRGRDASRAGIFNGLRWLKERLDADRSENATAVVYYSGHGAFSRDTDSYYLLPYDLRPPLMESLIRATDLADEIEKVRPRRLLVIFDCCHAGGMGIKGEDLLAEERLVKSAAPPEARVVVALMKGQGRAVLSSSTAAENSYVRSDRAMSIFTYHLVEALTGHAQQNRAAEVLVSDIMGYVTRRVPQSARAEYNVSQTPVYQTSGENFPVALVLGGEGVAKGQPLPDPLKPLSGPDSRTAGGGYVGGGVSAGGDVYLGSRSTGGDEIRGSKYVMSGDFRGALLNIESQLSNVTQTILSAATGEPSDRADLTSLVAGLQAEMERVPPGHEADVEALAARLEKVTAALADGDDDLVAVAGSALERAAAVLGDVRPGIPAAARQIAAMIRRLFNG